MMNFPFGEANRRPRESPSEGSAARRVAGTSSSNPLGHTEPELQHIAWQLMDKSGQIIMLAASDGKLRYANRAAHLTFGYELKEDNTSTILKQNWLSWVHPADIASLEETLKRLNKPDSHSTLELRLRCDGSAAKIVDDTAWRWFEITITNFVDDKNAGWLLQARDISARRESEESLCRATLQFAETQRLASLGYWEWDLDSGAVQWSEELFHIFGLRPGETQITYDLIESRIHPDDRGGARLAAERAVRERKIYDRHYRIERPSGAIRTLHVRARVVIGAGDRVTHLSGIAQDVTESMETEQDLRQSEARFRRISDSNIIGIMSWDASGTITEANDAFLRLVGYTRSDLWEGLVRPDELTPPEFRAADARALRQLSERGACAPYQKEYVRKDGTRVPVLIGAAYLEQGTGGDLGICYVLDRTGAQAAEMALRDSEMRYRQLVETSPDAIFVHRDGKILFANSAAAQLLGARTTEELIGLSKLDLIAPTDREYVQDRLMKMNNGEQLHAAVQIRVQRLDAEIMDVEVTSNVMQYEKQRAIQSVLRDVSQRQKAESELRRSEEKLRLLIENVPDAITILDKNGDPIYNSPAVECLTGYPPEEFVREMTQTLVHPDDRDLIRRFLKEIVEAPQDAAARSVEYRLRHKNGSWRVLETVGKPLPPGAPYEGILVATRDTTRRRDVENRLRQVSSELEAIYEAFPDVYMRLTADGVVLAYHAAQTAKFPVSVERVFGKRVSDLLPQPASAILTGALEEVKRTRRPLRFEFELPQTNATGRYEARLQPLLDDQIVAIVRDITEDSHGTSTIISTPSLFVEPPPKSKSCDIGDALQSQQGKIEAIARERGLKVEISNFGSLEVALEKALVDEALDIILKSALDAASSDYALRIGYEARFDEVPLTQSVRLRGRACVHVIGQGKTDKAKSELKQLQDNLAPHDAEVGIESAGNSFVFWLDLPAARIF